MLRLFKSKFHLIFGVSLVLLACNSPVNWDSGDLPSQSDPDSLVTYYRTKHFVFFYDSSAYRKAEVISNGKIKEAHLKRINSELKVSFDGEIMVRLIHSTDEPWSGQAFIGKPYFIQETRSYFLSDNGHEIVHIVSFESLGFPEYRFFVEGLAVAHELDASPKWARSCEEWLKDEPFMDSFENIGNIFVSREVNYPLAGAYVEWLEETFGVETFKIFYRDLDTFRNSSYESICLRVFGFEPKILYQRFIDSRKNKARGSKYCGQG